MACREKLACACRYESTNASQSTHMTPRHPPVTSPAQVRAAVNNLGRCSHQKIAKKVYSHLTSHQVTCSGEHPEHVQTSPECNAVLQHPIACLWWAPKVSKSSKTLQNSSKQASEEADGCELRCEYLISTPPPERAVVGVQGQVHGHGACANNNSAGRATARRPT